MENLSDDDPRHVAGYALQARLGDGATGSVYLARSEAGRSVALKLVRGEPAGDPAFRARLRAEVASARLYSWMSTTPVLNADPDGEPPWVATAFVAGVPLSRAVAECGPLPEPVLFAVAREIAVSLLIVHGARMVHRGVAPGKMLLAPDRLHLMERSVVARALDAPASSAFLAPEQTQARSVTSAADLFALGSTLYYAATGRPPFGDGPAAEMAGRLAKASPVLGFLPPALAELIGGCLAKDPNARATARQVLDFIDRRGPGPLAEGWLPPVLIADIAAQTAATAAAV
ncbi:serine/threonine-protein kinase [Catenulispora subtropica]|uniref:Protein kinase domain-containing protein n=1 Tax=Catenulispora subtropica TaxID=450798 RepID=A0ABP5D1H3_9ACTN